ncbi:MAG: hypothetical protein ABIN67_17680 [Ferruginibacter sp.]
MYQIIAPSLFQNKTCRLPGIGTLMMVSRSAQTDFANSQILAPVETIEFIRENNGENVFNEFSAMSELLITKLDESKSVFLKGIGTLTRDEEGQINFEALQIDPVFFQPIATERVIRENTEHSMLVGDQQTTNFQMTEFFNEKPVLKSRWKIWALVLGAIAITVLTVYLYRHGSNSLGNMRSI